MFCVMGLGFRFSVRDSIRVRVRVRVRTSLGLGLVKVRDNSLD